MIMILNHLIINDFDFKLFKLLIIQNHFMTSYYNFNIIKLFHGLDETLIDYSLQDVNFAFTFNLQQNIYKKYSNI